MANNILIQKKAQAKDISALNRVAKCASDVTNGGAVAMTVKSAVSGESEVWVVTVPATATLDTGLWIAYSPEKVITTSGSNQYANIDPDPRNFTNLAGVPMDVFKPKVGDILEYTVLGGTKSTNTYVVASDATSLMTWASAAISGLSMKLLATSAIPIGTGSIGVTSVVSYVFEVTVE